MIRFTLVGKKFPFRIIVLFRRASLSKKVGRAITSRVGNRKSQMLLPL